MEPLDEWFSSEQLEEQITTQLQNVPQVTVNEQLLHDLQHVVQEDRQHLEQIRMRLLTYASDNSKRPPVPIQRYQQHLQKLQGSSERLPVSRSSTKRMPGLTQLTMGLVALLIVGSMFGIVVQMKSHQLLQGNAPTSTVATSTPISGVPIHGTAAFMLDATTGRTLVNSNGHAHLPLADTARLMTAVVTIENGNLNQSVTISQSMLQEQPSGTSSAQLQVGDQLTLRDLIYALLLTNGNDAATVIAHTVGGNTPNFVTQMNDEAHQLQLDNTHFSNPYGIPAKDEYSSAADLAHLAQYALQLSEFAQIFEVQQHSVAVTEHHHAYLWASNTMLTMSDITGATNGNNSSAGYCIVFSSHRSDGHVLIGAELGAPSASILNADVKLLLKQEKTAGSRLQ